VSEKWVVELELSNGATHRLVESTGSKKYAQDSLGAFIRREGLPYSGDWVPTESFAWVARGQVVEARVARL
jgi:hypothetical protein